MLTPIVEVANTKNNKDTTLLDRMKEETTTIENETEIPLPKEVKKKWKNDTVLLAPNKEAVFPTDKEIESNFLTPQKKQILPIAKKSKKKQKKEKKNKFNPKKTPIKIQREKIY